MRILLVEDSRITAELVIDALGVLGHEVQSATSAKEAELLLDLVLYDLVVLDVMVEDGSTYSLAERLSAASRPYCVATAMNPSLMKAPLCEAPLLRKPYSVGDLVELLERTRFSHPGTHENATGAGDARGHTPDE